MKTHHIAGVAAIAFGLLTLISGGSALFGLVDMGAVVPFVLWFNFLAGFAYVIGGRPVALTILIANATVFAVFGWRVFVGDAFEARTVGAMTFRTAFWVAMVWASVRRS